ncbi:MAG: signal peptide peptidase SppA [Candidatus Cloacimonadota bacterium]|nr:MAG: signal peptide peptidase SppA [Candidatus Cloacimonadota bacterium]
MKAKWFSFGCLTSIIVLVIIFITSITAISRMSKGLADNFRIKKTAPGSFLHLKLSGSIATYNEFDNSAFNQTMPATHEIVQKIRKAADDKNIDGILLEPRYIACGYANLNEIMAALEDFRAADKPVYAYLDFTFNQDYYLASIADRIYLNPSASAGILLTGVGGNVLFYKDLLDKIGVEVNVVHAGKYKGAGETFSRTGFSEPVKKNLNRLYDSYYSKILEVIAANRSLSAEEIRFIYESREDLFISQEKALEYNLVDELLFRNELLTDLNLDEKLVSLDQFQSFSKIPAGYKIAVVYAQGNIAPSNSFAARSNLSASKINPILDKLQKDNSIKAIVLRVNSPGGSALISEVITNKISQVMKHKPVVISMGNVAASGGYYISSNSDYIFADDFTITGSIGVVSMLMNINELADKFGVSVEDMGRGKFADAFSIYEKPGKAEIEGLRNSIEKTYIEFKSRVSEGRSMPIEEIEKIAQGQVWSSNDALENGLIDEIGLLSDAIKKAAELAGASSYKVAYYPQQKNFLEELLKEKLELDIAAKLLESTVPEELKIDKAKSIFENIKDDPIQTIMPFEIEIK